ncbi:hypothetical protein JM81_0955 [Maribacter sp. MAR_2009_72]|nr:hypothetical protein JM81_0955 [Maribacter sp. MAR_2009_72]
MFISSAWLKFRRGRTIQLWLTNFIKALKRKNKKGVYNFTLFSKTGCKVIFYVKINIIVKKASLFLEKDK